MLSFSKKFAQSLSNTFFGDPCISTGLAAQMFDKVGVSLEVFQPSISDKSIRSRLVLKEEP